MSQKLGSFPLEIISSIRYVQVSANPQGSLFDEDSFFYRASRAYKFPRGLKLDKLTIHSSGEPELSYESLDFLIKHSQGWKELHFYSHDSTFLAYQHEWLSYMVGDPDVDRYLRFPQPASWNNIMKSRDGINSGSAVRIHRSVHSCPTWTWLLDPAESVEYSQALAPDQTWDDFGKEEYDELMAPGEREKGVLAIVRRGRDVDYEEKIGSQYHEYYISEEFPEMSWDDVKMDLYGPKLSSLTHTSEEYVPVVHEHTGLVSKMALIPSK